MGQGLDYAQDGRNGDHIAALILSKQIDIATSKIYNNPSTLLTVRLDTAATFGVTIPDDVMA